MKILGSRNDINILSPRYFIANTLATCPHCRSSTQVFALAVPPGHETLELGDEVEAGGGASGGASGNENAGDSWRVAPLSAFLFHVDYLPDLVQSRLGQFTRFYHQGKIDGVNGSCWTNHCEQCGSALDDQDLFCEPDGGFLPTSESNARRIHLLPIDEVFEAAAGGYAVRD